MGPYSSPKPLPKLTSPKPLPKLTLAKFEKANVIFGLRDTLNPIYLDIVGDELYELSNYFYFKNKKETGVTIDANNADVICLLLNSVVDIISDFQCKYWHFNFEKQEWACDCMVELFIDNIIEKAINQYIDEENAELEKIIMY
jgi:hypothetical protein